MASVQISYGTRAAYPNVTTLNSQGSAVARTIGAISATTGITSANPVGFKIDATIKLATTGVTSTGTLAFYLVESADGSTYSDSLNAATTTDQAGSIKNSRLVYVAAANANSQVVQAVFDLPSIFTPLNHTLLIQNGSGAALSSAGNSISYTPIIYTVA